MACQKMKLPISVAFSTPEFMQETREMCLHQAIWYSAAISITNLPVDVWIGRVILLSEPHLGESSLTEAKAYTWYRGKTEEFGLLSLEHKDIPKCLSHNQ